MSLPKGMDETSSYKYDINNPISEQEEYSSKRQMIEQIVAAN